MALSEKQISQRKEMAAEIRAALRKEKDAKRKVSIPWLFAQIPDGVYDPGENMLGKLLKGESGQFSPELVAAIDKALQHKYQLTSVYQNVYKSEQDSASTFSRKDPLVDSLTGPSTRVEPVRVSLRSGWSAKGITAVTRTIDANLDATRAPLELNEDFGNLRRGMVLIFREFRTPPDLVYIRFQSAEGTEMVRWTDPEQKGLLLGHDIDPVSATGWTPIDYVYAACWGVDDELTDARMSKSGIGPHTRLE